MLPAARWMVLVTLLLIFSFATVFINPVFAAEEGDPVDKSNFLAPQYSAYSLSNLTFGLGCLVSGTSLEGNQKCPARDNNDGKLKLFSQVPGGGALGGVNNTVLAVYQNPPTSTGLYMAHLGTGFGIVKEANAQTIPGQGNSVLEPVLRMWVIARNISYFVFIFILLAIGFMVMFRKKLNPQTVISIQSALPGVVIALILVTFSYLIASLIVDVSFWGVRFVTVFFTQSFPSEGSNVNYVNQYLETTRDKSIFDFYGIFLQSPFLGDFIVGVGRAFFSSEAINEVVGRAILVPALGAGGGTLPTSVPGISQLYQFTGKGPAAAIGGLTGSVIALIIIIALLLQLLKLLWQLILAYISILIMTILGPFLILAGAIPGKQGAVSMWWKTLLANSLIFPAVYAVFIFSGLFLGNTDFGDFQQTLPLFGGLPSEFLRIIIGYGILLGSPAIPTMIKEMFGVKDIKGIPEAAMSGAMFGLKTLREGPKKGYQRTMEASGLGAVKKDRDEERALRRQQRTEGIVGNSPLLERALRWAPRVR